MLILRRLHDKPYVTEFPMPKFDRVDPNPAVKDLAQAKIALVTSGGIVPKGNPDHIESPQMLQAMVSMILQELQILQETYETAMVDMIRYTLLEDPDRVLPVDVLRD